MLHMRDSDWIRFLLAILCIGAALGIGVVLGVPWLWTLVKPWLHGVTA